MINAATQVGKSEAISIAACLISVFFPNRRIAVVSATWPQAQIIFNRAKQHFLYDNPLLTKKLDLKSEFTNQTITVNFDKDTKNFIQCFTVGGASKGENILGFNATDLIIDETGSIDDEIYYTKVLRMIAAGRTDRYIIESGTPHKMNHMFESWKDPTFKKFHIDWKLAVAEGQLSQTHVNRMKEELSATHFSMWYEAQWPLETEDGMYSWNYIETAQKFYNEVEFNIVKKFLGVDVARTGSDLTIYTILAVDRYNNFKVLEQIKRSKQDTMVTAGEIVNLHQQHVFAGIFVDEIGIGAGVVDRLKEQNLPVTAVNVARKASNEKLEQFYGNYKAELCSELNKLMENKKITFPNIKGLTNDLSAMKKKFASNGQMYAVDPNKSPDFHDSLLMALAHLHQKPKSEYYFGSF